MTKEDIVNTLTRLAKEELSWEALPSGSFSQHLDSMQRMSLVVAIEDHFCICFEPEDEEEIDTLESLVHMIALKLDEST